MKTNIIRSLTWVAFLSFSLLASGSHSKGAVDKYQLDSAHSKLGFKVAHLGITSVSGEFKEFSGEVHLKGDRVHAAVASIKVPSVFTDNEKRDNHLKADDFFAADQHPMMQFKSTKVTQNGKNIVMEGELTIRNVTKAVTLKGSYGGKVFVDMWKVHKMGMSLSGTINRQDFGLKFNQFLGTGEAMVGDIVTLNIDIQANMPAS